MDSHENTQHTQRVSIYLILSLVILLIPLIYYGYLNIQKVSKINSSDDPLKFSASRYLYTGDWPSTSKSDVMISKFKQYIVNEKAKKNIAVVSELNAEQVETKGN